MTTPTAPLTAATARVVFYDVECLPNVFTVSAYDRASNSVIVFHLVDGPLAERLVESRGSTVDRIRAANPALPADATITFGDLRHYRANRDLAALFGMYAGKKVATAPPNRWPAPTSPSKVSLDLLFRPVCDSDPGYDPQLHPLLAGYNSRSYDTTILALYLADAFFSIREHPQARRKQPSLPELPTFTPINAADVFVHNNQLFSEAYRQQMPRYLRYDSTAFRIRKAMLDCGRHIDVSRFNEGVRIGLKRVLAGMGRQVLEFDNFGEVRSLDDLIDLIAYNVSDVVGLAAVFDHPVFAGTFDLKAGLMATYPECVYEFGAKPSPTSVRDWRLTLDTTAAQFAARILAPGEPLTDLDTVSFLYPEREIADELGTTPRNVLSDTLGWFAQELGLITINPDRTTVVRNDASAQARHAFNQVREALSYYRLLEGRNFNDSDRYAGTAPLSHLDEITRTPNNVPYFTREGLPTSGYVNFSIGGIHGAEYDLEGWRAACQTIRQRNEDRELIAAMYPDPLELWQATAGNSSVVVDGRDWPRSKLLTAKTRKRDLLARCEEIAALGDEPDPAELAVVQQRYEGIGYRPLEVEPPMFMTNADGSNKLHPKYARTSHGVAIHEDFTSYYPNLLRNMAAFRNPELGEDRYAAIFEQKEALGAQLADRCLDPATKARLRVLREGTKLILNSASGAADASRDTAVRMNNRILSMRIIGQLLTWRIGQAQTFAGARIVSTNTDGLYTVDLDEAVNNAVLAEQARQVSIGIEPEPVGVVSKDSNNRIEFKVSDGSIVGASGGSLAAFDGPTPRKSLAHPAVVDWALARYLKEVLDGNANLDDPLDRTIGERLIATAAGLEPFEACRLFQHILVSSPAKRIIPFGNRAGQDEAVLLPHTSRVFFVTGTTPGALTLQAATSSLTPTPDLVAIRKAAAALKENGWSRFGDFNSRGRETQPLPPGHLPSVRRITGVGPDWPALMANHDLLVPPAGRLTPAQIVAQLDLSRYLDMLALTFEANWRNNATEVPDYDDPDADYDPGCEDEVA